MMVQRIADWIPLPWLVTGSLKRTSNYNPNLQSILLKDNLFGKQFRRGEVIRPFPPFNVKLASANLKSNRDGLPVVNMAE